MSMRSFFPLLSVNPTAILAMVDIAASRMSGHHALSVHYGVFPATGVAYYRVADRLLFEQRAHGGDSERQWYVDFCAFEYVVEEIHCPARVLAYAAADSKHYYRLLIPPDPGRPKVVRWRILCTGLLDDDALEKFRGLFRSVQRDASWSQAMVPVKSPIIFAGER